MTKSSVNIHADKALCLSYNYFGKTDTAVFSIVDNDSINHAHATVFMDGVYSDRLERAVNAFNEIMLAQEDIEVHAFVYAKECVA